MKKHFIKRFKDAFGERLVKDDPTWHTFSDTGFAFYDDHVTVMLTPDELMFDIPYKAIESVRQVGGTVIIEMKAGNAVSEYRWWR